MLRTRLFLLSHQTTKSTRCISTRNRIRLTGVNTQLNLCEVSIFFTSKIKSTGIVSIRQFRTMSQDLQVKVAAYGSWKSPISSPMVSQTTLSRINIGVDLHPDFNDVVYWLEIRADEGGRYVVCSNKVGESQIDQWTPEGYNVRTRVHEYGGGAFFVYKGVLYFSNFADQRLYVQESQISEPKPLTPEKLFRYADGQYHHKNQKIYLVRESHEGVDNPQFAINTVVVLDPVSKKQSILTEGADFYSHPRASPDGSKICWIQWNHPNMPWDCTELWVADLNESRDEIVAGSAKKIVSDSSIMMPSFDLKNELLYISDVTDWWNLYHVTLSGDHVNLLPIKEEIGHPHWQFGNEIYAIDPHGGDEILVLSNALLVKVNRKTGESKAIETGYTSHTNLFYTKTGHAYCDVGAPNKLSAVIRVTVTTGQVEVITESKQPHIDPGYLSVPKDITWQTTATEVAHGYLYLPKNKDFSALGGTLPPLLLKVHGGPTSAATTRLNYTFQYFTSRGFAVLDINHRGSAGYGRKYRNLLRNSWGLLDIEDCSSGAKYLAKQGLIDADKVCISGGSAGGYTTLACATFTDTFRAGVSFYGVSDLKVLTEDCHKFESRYSDQIIAPITEEGLKVYKARSPIFHTDKLNCPLCLFQGTDDKIVPPNQAEMMYKVLKEKKLPTALCMFEGEQHGFRKAANIQKCLDGEFYFYSRIFKFEPADKGIVQLHIDNLD